MKILYIAPGNNPHTWKWVGWFGEKYPGEIFLIPYYDDVPDGVLDNVSILRPIIPQYKIAALRGSIKNRVKKLVHDNNPDILHALWAYGSGTYAAWTNFSPFILSPWGSDVTVFPYRKGVKGNIQKKLVVEALRTADYVTATSRYLYHQIEQLVPKIKELKLFPYGVDTSIFDSYKVPDKIKFSWPAGRADVIVGMFKNLESTYGPDLLIEALAKALKQNPGIRCVIGGDGSLRAELEKQAKDLGVSEYIVFTGQIPYLSMPRYLASIDIFVMPSRYEVFGVAALEASSMKLPVIISKKWGMIETAVDNVTGLFFEPENVDDLTAKIIKLAGNGELRNKFGLAGRKFVQENYEFDSIMNKADEYCRNILETSR
jgi:glycosyltransferase involved in cell wall biosynthesis